MATWIVHLRIAGHLLDRIPGLAPSAFAIGSIAPDCGVPDANWEKFTPDPQVTHFIEGSGPRRIIGDLRFYRQHLHPLRTAENIPATVFSFRLGYFFHLLTDNLWSRKVDLPIRKRWAEQFAANPRFIDTVKNNTYGLDFVYLRDHPGCPIWQIFLNSEYEPAGLDFLPDDAVRQRVEYIKDFYQRQDEEVTEAMNSPMPFLSIAGMDCFVEEAAGEMVRAFNRLWMENEAAGEGITILDMPYGRR